MIVAGGIMMQQVMEGTVEQQGTRTQQDDRQQTGERWCRQTANAREYSLPLHLYAPNQPQTPSPSKLKQRRYRPQQCLYFFPLPQGHWSLRPTLGPVRIGLAFSTASAASLTRSLP